MTRRRINERFSQVKAEGRAALITFIMGGDPDQATAQAVLEALPVAGADLIEIGMPFSDPMADGSVIQTAGLRALKSGTTLKTVLTMVAQFRAKDAATPVVLMGYYNPVYHYGMEKFCTDAAKSGADGVILVDLPPEEEDEFLPHAEEAGLALIRLISPTSLEHRLPKLTQNAEGFIYYISITGITGASGARAATVKEQVALIRQHSKLPIAVGFGVKTPEQAAQIAQSADAVVVGSALVEKIAKSPQPVKEAHTFVSALASALKN